MTKKGGAKEKDTSAKTKSLPENSKRQRKHSFDFRWVLLALAVICALGIGLSINNTNSDEDTADLARNLDVDDSDTRINWDRYQTVSVQLDQTLRISQAGTYYLTGNLTNGNIVIEAGVGKVRLILNDVTINNSTGPAILCKSADELVIEIAGNNILADGINYSEEYNEDIKGVIYSKSDLTFQGNGNLIINSNYQDGIIGKDDVKFNSGTYNIHSIDDAILGKDSVYITGGHFNINSEATAIKTTNTEDTRKGFILIEDGDFNIESSDKGLKATNGIIIKEGKYVIDTYDDAIHTNNYIGISGGTFNISSGDDAIHADKKIVIDGGRVYIIKTHEGIEAQTITINDGIISITASDDGINAGGKDDPADQPDIPMIMGEQGNNSNNLSINGGTIYINASGDGLDSNGWIYINGGQTIIDGPTSENNGALDASIGIVANGGEVLAIGSSGMAETLGKNSLINNISVRLLPTLPANTKITIKDSDNNTLFEHNSAKSFSHIAASTPNFKINETYKIYINDEEFQEFTIHSTTTTIRSNNVNYDKNEATE